MFYSAKSNAHSNEKKNRKKSILYSVLLAILLVAATAVVIVQTQTHKHASERSSKRHVQTVIRSSCSATLYPDLCVSATSSSTIKTPKDVLLASLNRTIKHVQQNYEKVRSLTFSGPFLSKHVKVALHDCLVTMNDTLVEIHKSTFELMGDGYAFKNYSFGRRVEDVKTLISAAMTNQETCHEGFSKSDKEREFRKKLLDTGLTSVHRLCSNVLAMINNLTEVEFEHPIKERRLSRMDGSEHEWPYWLSAGDGRLLKTGHVTPDVIVAADGSGNYRTVAAAVQAAPGESSRRYIIKIKAGIYRENVIVPKSKTNLMFIGEGRTTTIITASRNVNGGSTTFNSATVAVAGDGFLARDITFQNTAGPKGGQAVALRVNADFTAFYRCDILAYQDTLYVHSLRQFYRSCIIAGSVDFIFGNAAAVFQDCDIHARKPGPHQKNMLTAQGRSDPNQNTGIVIHRSRIGATQDLLAKKADFPTYLGRPWKQYSRTVVMLSEINAIINPAGWYEWNGKFALDTLYYAEYENTGAGAGTAHRVKWKGFKVITSKAEAQSFTAQRFISGSSWLGSTGFPYTDGL